MLNNMFNIGLKFPNSQVGSHTFQTPKDENYLVYTRVTGESPNPNSTNFNKQNLSNLVDIMFRMNTYARNFYDETGFRFMNYDFRGKKNKINPAKAEVYNF